MSSYQKIKERNEYLERTVFILLEHPNSVEAIQIKALHKLRMGAEKAIMFGSPMAEKQLLPTSITEYTDYINQVKK